MINPETTVIYLDLDGVLADFCYSVSEVARKHGLSPPDEYHSYDVHIELGIDKSTLWEWIEEEGVDFWVNMPITSYGKQLHTILWQAYGFHVMFVTARFTSKYAIEGTVEWIKKHFGEDALYFLTFARAKHLLASSKSILIDDFYKNLELFTKFGGNSVSAPTSYNNSQHNNDPLTYILNEVEKYAGD